ncbi:MAG: hypothetical protein ACE37K_17025 [Planctomycetota bacterium]
MSVPIGGTESSILCSAQTNYQMEYLGDSRAEEVADYVGLVEFAVSARFQDPDPIPVPVPPRSTLPSQQTDPICSSGTGGPNNRCSTDANQNKCSANGNEDDGSGHNCSAGDIGGNGECSTNSGDWNTRCSVHGGEDNHCSAIELPGNPGTAKCSAIEKGFCSVFGGGGDPGGNGGGGAGGRDNSCSAFGLAGENPQNPKCSAFANLGFPLCSVLKHQANATCTVVDSDNYGPGAGTCSTMNLQGQPVGPPPNFCSVVTIPAGGGPPTVDPPQGNPPRCTTSIPEQGGEEPVEPGQPVINGN